MSIEEITKALLSVLSIKPVPVYVTEWVKIPCHTADALDADDAMGDKFEILVPVSGILLSATLLDRDDEGTEIDVALMNLTFTSAAGDAAFSLSDGDVQKKIYQLNFVVFNDNVDNQESSIENIGKAYHIEPSTPGGKLGKFFCQAITRATPTIAAGSEPLIRLEILPDSPVD
ncbi:hypothetical protein LCGC14_1242740 [marine sediment metagenome]|uniref:Uncharacterized protein n=1 Tax=marine sediment metagenome TaxID=412755 RepID=A0A0F9P9G2_9ZZZZ